MKDAENDDMNVIKEEKKPTVVTQTKKIASHRLFLDDVEYMSFVRRLDWSPDGNILVTPSACYYDLQANNGRSNFTYTVYGFVKADMSSPAFMLPGIKTYATCVRFNPYIYEKKSTAPE